MNAVRASTELSKSPKCPKCANTQGIKDGGPTLNGHREYDILSDTFGVCRCPHCGYRAHYAEFHKPTQPR
jgi:predicted nucleic-acid-binding Zn-ribbon protein